MSWSERPETRVPKTDDDDDNGGGGAEVEAETEGEEEEEGSEGSPFTVLPSWPDPPPSRFEASGMIAG